MIAPRLHLRNSSQNKGLVARREEAKTGGIPLGWGKCLSNLRRAKQEMHPMCQQGIIHASFSKLLRR